MKYFDYKSFQVACEYYINHDKLNIDSLKNKLLNENKKNLFNNAKDTTIANYLYDFALNYLLNKNNKKAITIFKSLENIYRINHCYEKLCYIYINLNTCYKNLRNHEQSKHYNHLFFLTVNKLDVNKIPDIIINIATNYMRQKNYLNAYKLFKTHLKIIDQYFSYENKALFFFNFFICAYKLDKTKKIKTAFDDFTKELIDNNKIIILQDLYTKFEDFFARENNHKLAYYFLKKKNNEISSDIIKQKKINLIYQNKIELLQHSNFYSILVNSISSPLFVCDKDHNYIICNQYYADILQVSINDIIGKKLGSLVRLDCTPIIQEAIKKALLGESSKFTLSLQKNNNEYILDSYITQFKLENGKIEGAIGIANDITNLIFTQRELKNSVHSKDEMLSIIAHDLRNPMGSIAEMLNVLISDEYDTEELDEILHELSETSQNTYNLLENLLQWALAQNDKVKNTPKLTNMSSIIDKSLETIKFLAKKKDIDIIIYIKQNNNVLIDENIIVTILRNIISNSIKFTYEGGKIIIDVAYDTKNTYISISDNGIGMSQSQIDKISMSDRNNTSYGTNGEKGSGFGISLCKKMINKLNGRMLIESQEKKGTKITLSIPII